MSYKDFVKPELTNYVPGQTLVELEIMSSTCPNLEILAFG